MLFLGEWEKASPRSRASESPAGGDNSHPALALESSADPMAFTLDQIRRALAAHRPRLLEPLPHQAEAAVALVLAGAAELALCVIRRAERPGDPWSGHLALPGGRADPADPHPRAVAERETAEEVGLVLDERHWLGDLSHVLVRIGGGDPAQGLLPLRLLSRPGPTAVHAERRGDGGVLGAPRPPLGRGQCGPRRVGEGRQPPSLPGGPLARPRHLGPHLPRPHAVLRRARRAPPPPRRDPRPRALTGFAGS